MQPGGKFPTYTVELYGEASLAISSIDCCFVALNEETLIKLYLQKKRPLTQGIQFHVFELQIQGQASNSK